MKHEIKLWDKKHERDIRLNKNNKQEPSYTWKTNVKIDFKTPQKLTSYINENITLKRKACEILDCEEACNVQEHDRIETSWVCMMHRVSRKRPREGSRKRFSRQIV